LYVHLRCGPLGDDDVALRGVANVREGVAGVHRELLFRGVFGDRVVVAFDDLELGDGVFESAIGGVEVHCVADFEVFEVSEEGVAVAGDQNVAILAGVERAGIVADAFSELGFAVAVVGRDLDVDTGDGDRAEGVADVEKGYDEAAGGVTGEDGPVGVGCGRIGVGIVTGGCLAEVIEAGLAGGGDGVDGVTAGDEEREGRLVLKVAEDAERGEREAGQEQEVRQDRERCAAQAAQLAALTVVGGRAPHALAGVRGGGRLGGRVVFGCGGVDIVHAFPKSGLIGC